MQSKRVSQIPVLGGNLALVQSSSSWAVFPLKFLALTAVGRQVGGDFRDAMEEEKESKGCHRRI